MRYFIAGNVWLLVALALVLGRHLEREAPTRVSFLNLGNWFSPGAYGIVVVLTLAVALVFLALSLKGKNP